MGVTRGRRARDGVVRKCESRTTASGSACTCCFELRGHADAIEGARRWFDNGKVSGAPSATNADGPSRRLVSSSSAMRRSSSSSSFDFFFFLPMRKPRASKQATSLFNSSTHFNPNL